MGQHDLPYRWLCVRCRTVCLGLLEFKHLFHAHRANRRGDDSNRQRTTKLLQNLIKTSKRDPSTTNGIHKTTKYTSPNHPEHPGIRATHFEVTREPATMQAQRATNKKRRKKRSLHFHIFVCAFGYFYRWAAGSRKIPDTNFSFENTFGELGSAAEE